jgi:dephospho-CoA kinase
MFNVGLTGNVGAGKSTVARWFAEWGATIIDADDLVREVEAPGSPLLEHIAARFGRAMILPDGSLDRAALRRTVMGDEASRLALNALVHPEVEIARAKAVEAARRRGDGIVVHAIPLLFEVLDPKSFDVVVLVDAPVPVRRARLMADRGLSAEEADRLIAAQLPAEPKRARSHLVIQNSGSLDELKEASRVAWREIRRRAERPEPA